jgi:4a-hydroxytetrahydrobiopterin dehydratase
MWTSSTSALERTFIFHNFIEAFAFMTKVAMIAEKVNHHPVWTNEWNKVIIRLSTHDAGNIVTEKDLELAKFIDALYDIN